MSMIDREKLLEELAECTMVGIDRSGIGLEWEDYVKLDTVVKLIKSQPPADQWIPVTYHEATKEEKEVYGDEQPYILDCPLPEEEEEILVCTKSGYVFEATAHCDGGWFLDSGEDFMDIVAWQHKPDSYKGE